MPAIVEVRRREPLRALHYQGPADVGRLEELAGQRVYKHRGEVYKPDVEGAVMFVGNDDNYWIRPGDWVVKVPEDCDLFVMSQEQFLATFEVQ